MHCYFLVTYQSLIYQIYNICHLMLNSLVEVVFLNVSQVFSCFKLLYTRN